MAPDSPCIVKIKDGLFQCSIDKYRIYRNCYIHPITCNHTVPSKVNSLLKINHEEAQRLAEEAYQKLGLLTKTAHYTKSLIAWALAGYPVSSLQETTRRAMICNVCDKYAMESGCCSICGCPSNANGLPVKNKAAMATETCPYPNNNKWK